MDELDRLIINRMQDGFPISAQPFEEVAKQLNLDEPVLIERIKTLLREKILTRFGPLYNMDKMGGAYSLAAMRVPAESFDRTAEIVNSFDEVAHNYEREHEFNMWFVLATESVQKLEQVIEDIESSTGLHVYNMPKLKEYFVGLKFHV